MKRVVPLLILLAGCSSYATREAQDPYGTMTGMSVWDLVSCAGKPDAVTQTTDSAMVLTYDFKFDDPGVKAEFLTASLLIGGGGSCRALFTVLDDGTVADVAFTQARASGFTDPKAACEPIVSECLARAPSTDKPKGYSALARFVPGYRKPEPPIIEVMP